MLLDRSKKEKHEKSENRGKIVILVIIREFQLKISEKFRENKHDIEETMRGVE